MTKILFLEEDQTTFEIRRCIAHVLDNIQPIEMFLARDATEALELLDEVSPDVVVIEHEERAERELFLDALKSAHPPIIVEESAPTSSRPRPGVSYVERDSSLEGIHQLLRRATELAVLGSTKSEIPN